MHTAFTGSHRPYYRFSARVFALSILAVAGTASAQERNAEAAAERRDDAATLPLLPQQVGSVTRSGTSGTSSSSGRNGNNGNDRGGNNGNDRGGNNGGSNNGNDRGGNNGNDRGGNNGNDRGGNDRDDRDRDNGGRNGNNGNNGSGRNGDDRADREREERERAERERQAKEKAQREREARERAEREARERAEREEAAREKAQREKEARERAEKEARERAEREQDAREKAQREKEARERAEKERERERDEGRDDDDERDRDDDNKGDRDWTDLAIGKVTASGTGCRAGTWKAKLDASGQGFEISFSDLTATVTPQQTESIVRCRLTIVVPAPHSGMSYRVGQFDYTGYSYLENGVTAEFTTDYSFVNSDSAHSVRTELKGPFDDEYAVSDAAKGEALWSPCSTSNTLQVDVAVRLTNASGADGTIEVADATGLAFDLRACD